MVILSQIKPGKHLYDTCSGAERLVQSVGQHRQVVFLSFKHPQIGIIDRQPVHIDEVESRPSKPSWICSLTSTTTWACAGRSSRMAMQLSLMSLIKPKRLYLAIARHPPLPYIPTRPLCIDLFYLPKGINWIPTFQPAKLGKCRAQPRLLQ